MLVGVVLGATGVVAAWGDGGPGGPGVAAPVVVVGVGGLAWEDVTAEETPRLWGLLGDGAGAGAMSVRQVAGSSCPADGWLSLSAGQRSSGRLPDRSLALVPFPAVASRAGPCAPLPDVAPTTGAQARIPAWRALVALQRDSEYAPELGLLADTLAGRDVCATAVGPGAALALADARGVVRRYHPRLAGDSFDCPITVVDAGARAGPPPDVTVVDRRVGALVDQVPAGTSVLIVGLAEHPYRRLELGVALLTGPRVGGEPRFLVAATTRWDGVVRLLDVPSTLLAAVGVADPGGFYGAPITLGAERPDDPAGTVRGLDDISRTDRILRSWSYEFGTWPGAAQLVLYGLGLVLVTRGRAPGGAGRAFVALALGFAALPVAGYLVTLTRWWGAPSPGLALWGAMAAIAGGLAVLAGQLPARPLWWAAGGLSLVTTVVLALDAVTGTTLARGSLLGPSPILGGRFYGFGNPTFSVFVVTALVLAGAVAAELLTRNRRRLAVAAVLAIGALALVVDVWPTWGGDIGGGLSLLPGFALLALAVAGYRVTLLRLAAAGVGGVTLVAVVGVLDWLRPEAARSHAGRFVQQVIDGDAWELVERKAGFAWSSLGAGPTAWVTVALVALAAAALLRPQRYGFTRLRAAFDQWPTLRPTLAAILLTIVIGAAVNDYGIRIGTIALTTGLPLLAVTCARAGPATRAPVSRLNNLPGH